MADASAGAAGAPQENYHITLPVKEYSPVHFKLEVEGKTAVVTLNRPERKNPLTFHSYAELRDFFHALQFEEEVKTVVVTGAGGNFCSGGDVFEIIEPLLSRDMPGIMQFTRMTGDLVKAMRACPQPVVAAIDGVCVGAGAIIAMASDIRVGTAAAKVAFLFNKVGLAGCDMGACAILPRIIGQGRASELLYTGRVMGGEEAERWGFFNRLVASEDWPVRCRRDRPSPTPSPSGCSTWSGTCRWTRPSRRKPWPRPCA
jgi:enoyl-CoA hydratase/carnithine racemase